jgi:hypothetical protein
MTKRGVVDVQSPDAGYFSAVREWLVSEGRDVSTVLSVTPDNSERGLDVTIRYLTGDGGPAVEHVTGLECARLWGFINRRWDRVRRPLTAMQHWFRAAWVLLVILLVGNHFASRVPGVWGYETWQATRILYVALWAVLIVWTGVMVARWTYQRMESRG